MSVLTKMTAIADAIRAKTGRTDTLTLDEMASSLNAIADNDSSDLTVSGPTVTVPAGNYKAAASKSVATVTATTTSLNAGGSYTIPAGYHNGSGKVTANSLASQTDGTATADDIVEGMIAYVDGSKVTGTLPEFSDQYIDAGDIVIGSNVSYKLTRGAYTYDGTIYLRRSRADMASAIGLTAGKIVKGNTILNIAGTAVATTAAYFRYTSGGVVDGTSTRKLVNAAYTTGGTVSSVRYVTLPAGTYKVIGHCWYSTALTGKGGSLYIAKKGALTTALVSATMKEDEQAGSNVDAGGRITSGSFYVNLELTESTAITVVFNQTAGNGYGTHGDVCVVRIV